jgi:hypothetical protein
MLRCAENVSTWMAESTRKDSIALCSLRHKIPRKKFGGLCHEFVHYQFLNNANSYAILLDQQNNRTIMPEICPFYEITIKDVSN